MKASCSFTSCGIGTIKALSRNSSLSQALSEQLFCGKGNSNFVSTKCCSIRASLVDKFYTSSPILAIVDFVVNIEEYFNFGTW
jgi:hypothetical protein